MKHYEMGNGNLIDVAHRSIKPRDIKKMQDLEWVRAQGGICGIRELTEPRAIYFAMKERQTNETD